MIDAIKDTVIFLQFPFLPPTVNHYQRSRIIKSKRGKFIPIRYLTNEAKEFKCNLLKIIADKDFAKLSNELIGIKVNFCHSFLRKDGGVKKLDIDNRIKPLLDVLTESKIIPDDSFIFKLSVEKIISNNTSTEVFICKYSKSA